MKLSVNVTDLLRRTKCCITDTAYKALTQDMYLKPERFKTFQTVRYLQGLHEALNNYNQGSNCLTIEQAQGIIDQILNICSLCSSCD